MNTKNTLTATRARRAVAIGSILLLSAIPAGPAWSRTAAAPKPSTAPVSGPTAPPKPPVVAKAALDPAHAKSPSGSDRTGAAVTINGLQADGQGFAVLYWTLRNENAKDLGPGDFAADRWGESVVSPSGVSIVYEGQRHITLHHVGESNTCVCYENPPGIAYSRVNPGEEILLSQVFAVSPTAKTVTVEIPGFRPVPNVPVQR